MDGVRLSLLEFLVTAIESTLAAFLFETPTLADFAANAWPIVFCGVFSSGVAYTLQILGQKDLNPAIASLIMCLESVFSAIGGWLILHQSLSAREGKMCIRDSHWRPQFGQIRLLAPIAPPFHIDFVFLIVFDVFRDRID